MLLLTLLQACAASVMESATPSTKDTAVDSPVDTAPGVDTNTRETGEPGETAGVDSDTGEPVDTQPEAPKVCFEDIASPVDYLSSGATLNSTCSGTNHQEISGIERVVFVGDSVTAGAPPSPERCSA